MLNKEDFETILTVFNQAEPTVDSNLVPQFPTIKKKLELIVKQISLTEKYQEEAGKIRDELQALQPEK